MKLPSLVRSALISSLLAAAAATLSAQDAPTPYPDKANEAAWPGSGPIRVGNWMTDNRTWFWSQRAADQGAVVFVGDSLVGGWKGLGKAFPGLKIANRGIGGDVSRGVLFRFEEDVLSLNPRALVLCVGSNDLSAHGEPSDTISNISQIVDLARKKTPALPIVVCTIPPRNAPTAPTKPGAQQSLNSLLKGFGIRKENLVVLDIYPALALPDGSPNPAYIGKDGIHPTAAGYEKWTSLLAPVLKSLGVVAPAAK